MIKAYLRISICVVLMVLFFSITAHAQIIDLTFDVDFFEGWLFEISDSQGNPGKSFYFYISIDPFSVNAGDTVRTQLNFTYPIMLTQVPGSLFKEGNESFAMNYSYGSGTATWRYFVTLDVTDGQANATQFDLDGGFVQSPSGVLGVSNGFSEHNLTDSFMVISGMYSEIDIISLTGQQTVDNFYIHFTASDIEIVPEPAIPINLDIKPGSCPNPVNVKSKGVLSVAILGTDEFDVSTIDPTSVRLNGIEPIRRNLEDVSAPLDDPNECECTTIGPDGFGDLTFKFDTQQIVEALGEVNTGDILTLKLTGVLNDETPIEGSDCVVIVGRHKPINKADINEDGLVNTVDIAIVAENWLQSSIVEE